MRAWDTDLQKVTVGRQHVIPFGHRITKFRSLPLFSDELPSGLDHKAVLSGIRELRLQAEIVAGKGCKTGKVAGGPGRAIGDSEAGNAGQPYKVSASRPRSVTMKRDGL